MAFKYNYTNSSNTPPWSYLPAVAGTYKAGQLLKVNASGNLAALSGVASTTPPYVSQFDGVIAANASDDDSLIGGNIIAVARVDTQPVEYETELTAPLTLTVGQLVSVSSDGLSITSAAGTFEVTGFSGGAIGDKVTGKFTTIAQDLT